MDPKSPSPLSTRTPDVETQPQPIDTPLTGAATFLVLTINEGEDAMSTARSVVASIGDLTKNVAFRAHGRPFSCILGISHRVWGRLTGASEPSELTPFKEVKGQEHTAVATPGDLLLHLRADSPALIVEFERIALAAFGDSVTTQDEVAGFRYFDARDLLEFVDGTANPTGLALPESTLVGQEDPVHAGGSYVVVQKYLHDLDGWLGQPTQSQEEIIGRTKFDNVELPDAEAEQQKSHKTLCTIADDEGEHDILRDNMPFAAPGRGEYGTYFIGYSRHLWVTERMLERMFIGDPPGKHDRILDFSTPVTGATFFCPSLSFLEGLSD